jgi:hypothetical protein
MVPCSWAFAQQADGVVLVVGWEAVGGNFLNNLVGMVVKLVIEHENGERTDRGEPEVEPPFRGRRRRTEEKESRG